MKPNISLACKKSPFLPPVRTVLGQFPRSAPNTSPNPRANPNPNPNQGQFSLGGGLKTKETKNRKEIKNDRRKKKEIKQSTLSFVKL